MNMTGDKTILETIDRTTSLLVAAWQTIQLRKHWRYRFPWFLSNKSEEKMRKQVKRLEDAIDKASAWYENWHGSLPDGAWMESLEQALNLAEDVWRDLKRYRERT